MYLCCVLLLCPAGIHATEQTIVEGDGYEVVEDFETSKSEITSCSLTVQAVCPDNLILENDFEPIIDTKSISGDLSVRKENK